MPSSSQIWICKFVNNKQMAFLPILVHNNYCFYFKTSRYNVDSTDCVSGQTDLCPKSAKEGGHPASKIPALGIQSGLNSK